MMKSFQNGPKWQNFVMCLLADAFGTAHSQNNPQLMVLNLLR